MQRVLANRKVLELGIIKSRHRREEITLRIRKEKKDEALRKRRGSPLDSSTSSEDSSFFSSSTTLSDHQIAFMINDVIKHTNDEEKLNSTLGFIRGSLTEDTVSTSKVLVDSGSLSLLVSLLQRSDSIFLQHEAAWVLLQICRSNFCDDVLMTTNSVLNLASLLQSPAPSKLREQVALCLGIIAKDRVEYRDCVIELGVVQLLLRNIHECSSDNSSLLTATSFALSCICHGTIQPHPTKLAPIIYCAASLVLSKTCPAQVVTHALKCLAYISIDLREVFTVGAFPLTQRLVQLVSSESHQELALRTLIHICRGPEFHIRVVLSSGILDISEDVLKESNSSALKIDMCKLFSEMRSKQVLQLIDKPEILNAITGLSLEGACEWPVRKEAIAVVFNIALRAREYSHFQALVRNHTIEAVVDALHIRIDNALVLTALDCVERLLAFGEQNNEPYGLMIDQCGGIDKIEDLSNHNCSDIAKSAAWILDTYNTEEDSLDGEDWRLNLSTSPELYHHDPIFFQDALDSQP